MVLVDTSVWIGHLRKSDATLAAELENGRVLMHPWIAGELACGNLGDRAAVLADLNTLPRAEVANDVEAMELLERERLWGSGLGWVDVHLLASALITRCWFWTLDAKLKKTARELGVA